MASAPQRINVVEPVRAAYRRRAIDVWVVGTGRVVKALPDDNLGSRHQRFILEIKGGAFSRPFSILVAHNIDLARRAPVKPGVKVRFKGEYKWTDKGGTLHWTHHDPANWHDGGWLKKGMRKYA